MEIEAQIAAVAKSGDVVFLEISPDVTNVETLVDQIQKLHKFLEPSGVKVVILDKNVKVARIDNG